MIRLFVLAYAVPAAIGIIVTDSPAPIDYKYSYNVQDPSTGDTKTQHEVRQGRVVTGQYSVVEPDGTKRIVDYNVHPHRGFLAVVHTEPHFQQPYTPPKNYVIKLKNIAELQHHYSATGPKVLYSSFPERHLNFAPYPYETKSDYGSGTPGRYFTPAKEIASDVMPLKRGQYFIPASKK